MRFVLLLLLWALPLSASADADCYDAEPVVEITESWDLTLPARVDFYLPTRTVFGGYTTRAAAHIAWDGMLQVMIDNKHPPQEPFGLQYTVHRLQILVGEESREGSFLYDHDFTFGCEGPGRSVSPDHSFRLPAVKVPPLPSGAARERETLRIHIWGKHT